MTARSGVSRMTVASQIKFAMAKAIASGDSRLVRNAGLASKIARLQSQRAVHIDDQHVVRCQIRDARCDQVHAEAQIEAITGDLTGWLAGLLNKEELLFIVF